MEEEKKEKENQKTDNHWWSVFLRGILAIALAMLLFFTTGFTLDVILIFLGIFLLLNGLFSVIGAFGAKGNHGRWWLLLIGGIISIVAGLVVFTQPEATLIFFAYLIAIWAIVIGIFDLIASFAASWAAPGKTYLGVAGIISIIFGIIVFVNPAFSLVAIIWLIGFYILIIGLLMIIFSFKLKSIK